MRRDTVPPVVFLGPSLPLQEAKALLDADYRPPVHRGDFRDLSVEARVVILDGEFGQSLSISPKEIWLFIQRGGQVFGASSMGALRAVELRGLGMIGLGWIYEAYKSGRVIGDDEVALTYSPLDFEPLTTPLINVRHWLEGLVTNGSMTRFRAARALAAVRAIHFTRRFREELVEALASTLGHACLELLLARTGGISDIKAEDSRLALRVMSERRENTDSALRS